MTLGKGVQVLGLQGVHGDCSVPVGEGTDKMRARDELENGATTVDTTIQNLDMVVGTMGSLGGLRTDVVVAADGMR